MEAGLYMGYARRSDTVGFIHDPSFWAEYVGISIIFVVVSIGPSSRADADAFGEKLAVDFHAAGEDGPAELAGARGRQAHGFVQTRPEVLAR